LLSCVVCENEYGRRHAAIDRARAHLAELALEHLELAEVVHRVRLPVAEDQPEEEVLRLLQVVALAPGAGPHRLHQRTHSLAPFRVLIEHTS
jgi:hypothetical protein